MWKFYALPKIARWFTEYGTRKLLAYLDKVIDEPESEEAQRIGKLTGVAFAYLMHGIEEQLSTPEGRAQFKPLLEVIQQHVMGSVFASWGHLINKLKEEGAGSPLEGNGFNLPAPIAGLAGRFLPEGVNVGDIIQILGWLSQFKGGQQSGSSSNGPPTTSFSPARAPPHRFNLEM